MHVKKILLPATVCVLYLATAKLGLEYAVVGHTVTLLWPPSGIALAAILIGGYRLWPGISLGALLANLGTGVPMISLLMIVLGNTLEPLFGAMLLRRQNGFSYSLDKVPDMLALVLFAAVFSTTVSASLGTLGLLVGGAIATADAGPAWLAWWLGDGMGVLIISPIMLIGVNVARANPMRLSPVRKLEALSLIVAVMVVGQAIFGSQKLAGIGHYPVSLSLFPFLIWSALRFGTIGASSVTLIASLLAVYGTAQGTGPLVVGSAWGSMVLWCLFADIMSITGLLLGAMRSEREKAMTSLRNSNQELERRVHQRTEELSKANHALKGALTERWRLEADMNQISEERKKMIGQELHDGLGQQLTGIAFLVAFLRETLNVRSAPELPAIRQIEDLLGEAISEIRSLSRGLYPVALETDGIAAALHRLAEHVRSFSGIECVAECTAEVNTIDKPTALSLYRIAQEAVTNAMRHGKAKRIDIKLWGNGKHYGLAVEDNGIGLSVQTPKGSEKLGLRSMQCRAELIGAEITIRANRNGGTSVFVTGPIKSEE